MPRTVKQAKYLYAIRDKKTKQLLNKKSNSANSYYVAKRTAMNKLDEKTEEIVTYQLLEVIT